jgi:ABC-type multidrug transport system fused ATPase/permease subunit
VLNAERIIVMDQGCIQGIGTHAELCESNALYRRLATLQFFDGVGTLRDKDNGQRARG